ncbi:hypothetical protein K1719_003359 [Acacia pycnantha]|nr:hypothetical protein K1719_003359 [Acacia pycnantha]
MDGMASLLQEWCPHVDAQDRELMLAATVAYSPHWPYNKSVYPIDSMARYLNLKSFSYIIDRRTDFPATDSALYDPSSNYSTDYGINKWIHGGLMPSNVLGLAFFGYAWNLTDPENKAIAVPGTAEGQDDKAKQEYHTSRLLKGILPDGEKIAVKRRSKGSTQGYIEFKNETTLNPRLQHVNLVRLFGFCKDREEQMLVYEYMPNKSLDFYLSDPTKQHLLNWKQRVCIIEGVTQGLIYLQEYSRLTIIHRDLKASNILLDHEMKPKISDFGMAKPFRKDEPEERASKLVGTYGYIPPEYVEKGLCSIKSDVYSFGIILLQIISGKRISCLYGENNDLNLLEYAYVLWKEGKGMEFMDSSLDDTSSPCKLMRCLEIALLCVQKNAEDRPCMLEVGLMLRNKSNFTATPKQPAYSRVGNEEAEICSQNETTMSPVWVR